MCLQVPSMEVSRSRQVQSLMRSPSDRIRTSYLLPGVEDDLTSNRRAAGPAGRFERVILKGSFLPLSRLASTSSSSGLPAASCLSDRSFFHSAAVTPACRASAATACLQKGSQSKGQEHSGRRPPSPSSRTRTT